MFKLKFIIVYSPTVWQKGYKIKLLTSQNSNKRCSIFIDHSQNMNKFSLS